jgi:tRNA A37 threonylcarbamoyladenosine modification protein TsaB
MDTQYFPLVIILTHRKGAALALLNTLDDENFLVERTEGKTAENLLRSYENLLKKSSYKSIEIQSLAVGVGPGSFTGLRLGCAFANGIKIGQNCHLIPIKTEFASHYLQDNYFKIYSPELKPLKENNSTSYTHRSENLENQNHMSIEAHRENFIEQLGDYDPSDESSGLVTTYDILNAIEKLKNQFTTVAVLEPNYGREPGPVLKLRGIIT